MKTARFVSTLVAAGMALAPAAPLAAQASDQRPTVAIMYFSNASFGKDAKDYESLGRGIGDLMITDLSSNPGIRVVDRDAIDKLMKEQDLGNTQRVDQETAARIGKLLGARYMVFGSLIVDSKGSVTLNARAVDVETSRIAYVESVTGKSDAMMDVIRQLTDKMNKGMKLPDLPRRTAMTPTTGGSQQVAQAPLPQKVPFAAVMLYSKALKASNEGRKDEAVTLFRKCVTDFPEFDKPKEELRKIGA